MDDRDCVTRHFLKIIFFYIHFFWNCFSSIKFNYKLIKLSFLILFYSQNISKKMVNIFLGSVLVKKTNNFIYFRIKNINKKKINKFYLFFF